MNKQLRRYIFSITVFALQFFVNTVSHAQISVGVYNQTIIATPSQTVSNGTSISVSGLIENKGTVSISDNIHVHLGIDTSTTAVPKYYWRVSTTYSLSNYNPGDTFAFTVTDVALTANSYKGGGDGTTVVIWATVGVPTNTATTHDTAFTNVYIELPVSLYELLSFEQAAITFKNPTNELVHLNYDEVIYTKVELYNMDGKLVSVLHNKILNISEYTKGLYLLIFYNEKQNIYITKKIIIE